MSGIAGLRRFAVPSPASGAKAGGGAAEAERCELCGEQLGPRHPHLADLERRSIGCACTACALLFSRPGGRYRTVPDRVRHDPDAPLTEAEWAELRIPVGIAFFFRNSAMDQVVASYPSPAGVTECELDLDAWGRLAAAHPLLDAFEPDVEALLVISGRAPGAIADGATAPDGQDPDGPDPDGTTAPGPADDAETDADTDTDANTHVETFLVPIDVCYSLAGALRLDWRGFDGGPEVRRVLKELLADLRQRTRPLEPAAG